MFLFYILIYFLSVDLYAVQLNATQESIECRMTPMMRITPIETKSFLAAKKGVKANTPGLMRPRDRMFLLQEWGSIKDKNFSCNDLTSSLHVALIFHCFKDTVKNNLLEKLEFSKEEKEKNSELKHGISGNIHDNPHTGLSDLLKNFFLPGIRLDFDVAKLYQKKICEQVLFTRTLQERIQPQGILIGKDVWIRRLFPQDVIGLTYLYGDPKKMRLFGFGKTYDAPWVKQRTIERTMIQKHYPDHVQEIFFLLEHEILTRYTWSFFNHRGWSGTVQFMCDPNDGSLEIAYIGQGGTSEAVRLLLECIPSIHVRASVHPENTASIHILKKNDFHRIEENVEKYGSVRDIYQRNKMQKKKDTIKKK